MKIRDLTLACAVGTAFSLMCAAVPAHAQVQVMQDKAGIGFDTALDAPALQFRVTGPGGFLREATFLQGESLRLAIDGATGWPDGDYRFEIWPITGMAKRSGVDTSGRGTAASSVSGSFQLVEGALVAPDASVVEARHAAAKNGDLDDPSLLAQVIPDDLIVQGSECVGIDCTSTESFGFDTIRLKENNLRIKFEDTSASAGFPTNDWQLTANDSASGGASKFSIDDITGVKTPFTITAGAATNSIFVDSTGRVGFRTSTPVLDLHVSTSNTPGMRLEQTSAGGFTAQTWDIAGNEANFFVRDVTSGSRLPFRIRPGAPTSSIDIAADGDVGIGTAAPAVPLHLKRSDGSATATIEEASTTNAVRTMLTLQNNGGTRLRFENTSSDDLDWLLTANHLGFAISEDFSGVQELMLQHGTGNLTIAGTLTQNSDFNRKTNILPVDPFEVLGKVLDLPISTWAYKEAESVLHLGPMAQDFHARFGLGEKPTTIATIDTSGVALASIQALYRLLQQRDAEIDALKARLDQLEARSGE